MIGIIEKLPEIRDEKLRLRTEELANLAESHIRLALAYAETTVYHVNGYDKGDNNATTIQ